MSDTLRQELTALLPADPQRGITDDDIAAHEVEFDGSTYDYGMTSAVGAARLTAALDTVRAVLSAGCGRDAALAALRGVFVRLERDGLNEYSDTVVRESIASALEADCEAAGVQPFTDGEVGEVALLLSVRAWAAAAHVRTRRFTADADSASDAGGPVPHPTAA